MKIPILFLLALALIATALLFIATTLPAPVYASDPTPVPTKPPSIRSSPSLTRTFYFPLVYGSGIDPCSSIPGQNYGSVAPYPPPPDRIAAQNADINLNLRGHTFVTETKALWDYGNNPDPGGPPQLSYLFSPRRVPTFSNTYQVGKWDWGCNCRIGWDDAWPVGLLGMGTLAGEIIYTPSSGYDIGMRPTGYEVMVLYATTQQITLVYHRYDSIVISDSGSPYYGMGYGIHVKNICVEPNLLSLYDTLNQQGRSSLPALNSGQPFGRARVSEIQVAIRDSGQFMDPRSRRDWWQGY